jgi:hypothetical protein
MMKQPAENTNATEQEAMETTERVQPLTREPTDAEVSEVAQELWRERGGTGGSAEEDWFRAAEIVRQRRAATIGNPMAGGNASAPGESYVRNVGATSSERRYDSKEPSNIMDNYTGTTERTGSMMDRARETADQAREQINRYAEDTPKTTPRTEHREGRLARSIEQQTARIPSDAWLWGAVGSMGLSLALELAGKERTATFVGHWAPTLLIFGLYNKLVKLQGSDGV